MTKDNLFLKRVANHLIVNASSLDNLGLYNGKMGIVLFFVHYARYIDKSIYDDYANELLGEIYEELNDDMLINFRNGLCGIGWGILYLLENNFMDGDSNEILEDIDKKIMERDLLRITDFSIETGLRGISCYIKKRLSLLSPEQIQECFDKSYLLSWAKSIKQLKDTEELNLLSFISNVDTVYLKSEFHEKKLGLNNGYSGYGLKIMLT